jgi:tetratricopeptide (TPR) repeat protein
MSENNKGFYEDYKQINQVVVEEIVHNLKVDTSAEIVPSEEQSTSSTPIIHQLNRTTSGRTTPAATPQDNPITAHDIHAEAVQSAASACITVRDLDPKSYSKDRDINEWWRLGMLRHNEGEFAGAELFLEKALKHSKVNYGTEFPERAKLFGTLASACAHQGKRERVEQILDEYDEAADWRHRVLELLLSGFLEEGKSKQATEIFVKYGKEFIGREGALGRLMSMCSKHGCWSMAASITGTYPRFPGRESALEACISACREQSRWDQAEGFLLELSKEKTGNQVKESGIMHSLAEVYFAKKDLKSAQLFCQKAIDLRTSGFGKTHPLFQESIYLIGKIIYEANGDLSEFASFRHVLPPKIQGTNLE